MRTRTYAEHVTVHEMRAEKKRNAELSRRGYSRRSARLIFDSRSDTGTRRSSDARVYR